MAASEKVKRELVKASLARQQARDAEKYRKSRMGDSPTLEDLERTVFEVSDNYEDLGPHAIAICKSPQDAIAFSHGYAHAAKMYVDDGERWVVFPGIAVLRAAYLQYQADQIVKDIPEDER
jgi:hypothetical protein